MQSSAVPHPLAASGTAPGAPAHSADPWLEVEDVVVRLTRLVLHAHSLAERTASLPVPSGRPDPARADRVLRLRAGADLGSRALQAAVRVDVIHPRGVAKEVPHGRVGEVPRQVLFKDREEWVSVRSLRGERALQPRRHIPRP